MAYTGFILTAPELRPFNSLSITEAFLGALTGFFLAINVHSPREAATKTGLCCAFHCTNVSELGHIPRKPRLTSEAKAFDQGNVGRSHRIPII
jgi:hypothetical protein